MLPRARILHAFILISTWCSSSCAPYANAQEPPPIVPKICNGYLRYTGTATWVKTLGGRCPADYSVYGAFNITGPRNGPPERISLFEACCPLPADDVLTEETVQVIERCPPDFVVTGADSHYRGKMRKVRGAPIFRLTCTRINTDRYQLAPPRQGLYWGLGATYWKQQRSIFLSEIPQGLRHGISMYDVNVRLQQGCVGYPFGSLLVAKAGKRCHELLFSELQFRGIEGDPAAGMPVPMFPDCVDVRNVMSTEPICEAP